MGEGEISVLQNFLDDLTDKNSDAYKKFTTEFSTVVIIFHVHKSIIDSFCKNTVKLVY